LIEFKDAHKQTCSMQDSSLPMEPCIWLGVGHKRMCLTQTMAKEVVKYLGAFVDKGYLE